MSKKHIEDCVRNSLDSYFRDLRGTEPDGMYDMLVRVVEKPLLDVVMTRAEGNQSKAAKILGITRGSLRNKTHALGIKIGQVVSSGSEADEEADEDEK